ncbi:MAG: CPBP family intramembrane metalloprotease [Saccharofermentans sp.]|nr:CPBP family intramembrane metalloprotease [Saccharofermentans sp.]
MNSQGWASGDRMQEEGKVKNEPLGLKIALGGLDLIKAIGAVVIMMMAQVMAIFGVALLGFDLDAYDGTSTFIYTILAIPLLVLYLKLITPRGKPMFMNDKLNTAQIVFVVVMAFGLMGIVTVYLIAANGIAELFESVAGEMEKYSESVDRYSEIAAADIPVFDHILNFIGVCILVPITEELTFRAGVLNVLLKRYHPIAAVLISAFIFGSLHGISIHIGYALIAGFFLGWVYFYTKSIKSTVLMHMLFNLFGSGIQTLLDSGIFGDASAVIDAYSSFSLLLEFALMIPAIVCFFFLRAMYKNSLTINTVARAEATYDPEYKDPFESFVPEENAPSPFAPAKEDKDEMKDEQA